MYSFSLYNIQCILCILYVTYSVSLYNIQCILCILYVTYSVSLYNIQCILLLRIVFHCITYSVYYVYCILETVPTLTSHYTVYIIYSEAEYVQGDVASIQCMYIIYTVNCLRFSGCTSLPIPYSIVSLQWCSILLVEKGYYMQIANPHQKKIIGPYTEKRCHCFDTLYFVFCLLHLVFSILYFIFCILYFVFYIQYLVFY